MSRLAVQNAETKWERRCDREGSQSAGLSYHRGEAGGGHDGGLKAAAGLDPLVERPQRPWVTQLPSVPSLMPRSRATSGHTPKIRVSTQPGQLQVQPVSRRS